MQPTQLVPQWEADPQVQLDFRAALQSCGPRAKHLSQILADHEAVACHIWSLNLETKFFLVMLSAKDDDLLRQLGSRHGFPRGFPILWQPGQRLHFCGFYPKFGNDDATKTISACGADSLSFTVKWSGFLFCLLAFNHEGKYYWLTTSKNSGNCSSSRLLDFTGIAGDVIRSELGGNLADVIRILADEQTYVCGELLSRADQSHGYGYRKDAAIVTCVGAFDNQYTTNCSDDSLLQHFSYDAMRSFAKRCCLRCVHNIEVPKHMVRSLIHEMESCRDFLTVSQTESLLSRFGLPTAQLQEHRELINSETIEGVIWKCNFQDKPSERVKWKLPRYTFVTMLLRKAHRDGLHGHELFEKAHCLAKRWCHTPEGIEYYAAFGMLAGMALGQFAKSEDVSPWICAAELVSALDYDEVLHKGRELVSESRRGTDNVVDVLKHSSLGIAVVTLCSAGKRMQLLARLDRSTHKEDQFTLRIGEVEAEVKAHRDKETGLDVPDKIFLAWGRKVEKLTPCTVAQIVASLEAALID